MRRLGHLAASGLCGVLIVCAGALVLRTLIDAVRGELSLTLVLGALVFGTLAIAVCVRLPTSTVLGGYSSLIYAFLYAPILVVVVYAFNAGTIATHWTGVSTKWFSVAWSDEGTRAAVMRSFQIAVMVAIGCVALGTAAALALARSRLGVRLTLEALLLLTLVVPELVFAIALFTTFLHLEIAFGMATIMLGHIVVGSSLVALIVRARLVGMGGNLEEASADLGATPAGTLRQVVLPGIAPAMVAGGFLAFTFSFDNVIITQFTVGAGNETWPLRVLSALRFGVRPDVNATVTLMLGVTVVALTCAGVALRFGTARTRSRRDLQPATRGPRRHRGQPAENER